MKFHKIAAVGDTHTRFNSDEIDLFDKRGQTNCQNFDTWIKTNVNPDLIELDVDGNPTVKCFKLLVGESNGTASPDPTLQVTTDKVQIHLVIHNSYLPLFERDWCQ